MEEASKNLDFEKAAKLRDKIFAIENIVEKQKIFKTMEGDEDFITSTKTKKIVIFKFSSLEMEK